MKLIAPILIALCAVCKAVVDTLDHHYDTSVFSHLPRAFWDPNVIIKTGPQVFGYPVDAWHLTNSLQLACWLALPLLYRKWKAWYIDYAVGAAIFVLIFNLFYNSILR